MNNRRSQRIYNVNYAHCFSVDDSSSDYFPGASSGESESSESSDTKSSRDSVQSEEIESEANCDESNNESNESEVSSDESRVSGVSNDIEDVEDGEPNHHHAYDHRNPSANYRENNQDNDHCNCHNNHHTERNRQSVPVSSNNNNNMVNEPAGSDQLSRSVNSWETLCEISSGSDSEESKLLKDVIKTAKRKLRQKESVKKSETPAAKIIRRVFKKMSKKRQRVTQR